MNRQRGVALIIALLVVALASLLVAALLENGELMQARVRNGWRAEQSRQLARGLEAWAAAGLMADLRERGSVDDLGEKWARPMPPITLPDARIEGHLRDLGRCFNLNAIAPRGVVDPVAMARFSRLLRRLQLPDQLAVDIADYIDSDRDRQRAGPEESGNPNSPLADASELLRLPRMTGRQWLTLSNVVCATPVDQELNLNTVPPVIWQALDDAIDPDMAQRLARSGVNPYPDMTSVQAALRKEGLMSVDLAGCGVDSRYYIADAEILIDGITFHRTATLQRTLVAVRVIARTQGRPSRGPES